MIRPGIKVEYRPAAFFPSRKQGRATAHAFLRVKAQCAAGGYSVFLCPKRPDHSLKGDAAEANELSRPPALCNTREKRSKKSPGGRFLSSLNWDERTVPAGEGEKKKQY